MKFPTIVSLFLVFMTLQMTGFGQITKGNFIIDGGLASQLRSYNHPFLYSHQPIKEHTLNFSPRLSYFVSDRLVIGGGITINSNSSNLEEGGYGLTTHIRYYVSKKNNSAWFVENHLGYSEISTINFFTSDIGLGLDYFLSPSVALEGTVAFNYSQRLASNSSPYGTVETGRRTAAGIGMGLKFFLNRALSTGNTNQIAKAQKGTLWIGATSDGLSFSSQNGFKVISLNLNPNIGVFINENWLIGSGMNIDYDKEAYPGNSFYTRSIFQVGVAPFIRFYHSTKKGRIVPFYEVGGAINRSIFTSSTSTSPFPGAEEGTINDQIKNTDTAYFGGLGLNLFVSPSVALEFKGTYKHTKLSPDFKTNHFGLDIGFQFFIGK